MQCDKAESNHSQLTKSQLVTLQVLFRLEDWLLISRKICLLPSTRAVSRIQKGSWYVCPPHTSGHLAFTLREHF